MGTGRACLLLLSLAFLAHSYLFYQPDYSITGGRQIELKRIRVLKSSLTEDVVPTVIDRSLGGTIVVSGIGDVEEDEFFLSLLNQQVSLQIHNHIQHSLTSNNPSKQHNIFMYSFIIDKL
jgi:hypothetical protein